MNANPLFHAQVEEKVLRIVDRLGSGQPIEDSLVELKRMWPSAEKAARRIAGHANASFGSDVLWLIGLDEKDGLVGALHEELSSWWPQVCALFDGAHPTLTDFNIQIGDKTVVALAFTTERLPFVVKYPSPPNSGPVEREVPWREGTRVRSAKRSDLLRMLVPRVVSPSVEVLSGRCAIRERERAGVLEGFTVYASIGAYLVPAIDEMVVVPRHLMSCAISSADGLETEHLELSGLSSSTMPGGNANSEMIAHTAGELIAHGPGRFQLSATQKLDSLPLSLTEDTIFVRFRARSANSDLPFFLEATMTLSAGHANEFRVWKLIGC